MLPVASASLLDAMAPKLLLWPALCGICCTRTCTGSCPARGRCHAHLLYLGTCPVRLMLMSTNTHRGCQHRAGGACLAVPSGRQA